MTNLYISPPFGNWIDLLPGTIPIRGSFTLFPRPGLLSRLSTIHYSKEDNGWINKIGLRNYGIDYAISKFKNSWYSSFHKNNIISLAILEHSDIAPLISKIPNDTNLEINVSCPNTDHDMVKKDIQKFIHPERKHLSLKCSPLTQEEEIDKYYILGFRTFHFSNTIPHPLGGLSGPSIVPYTTKLTKYTRDKYGNSVTIIAGGGIRSMDDVFKYKEAGCDHVSISTLCFNPLMMLIFYGKFMYYRHFTDKLD